MQLQELLLQLYFTNYNRMQDLRKEYQWEKMKASNAGAIAILIFCAIFLTLLLFVEVPSANKDLVNFLSGTFFGTALSAVMYFLFDFKKKEHKEDLKTDK